MNREAIWRPAWYDLDQDIAVGLEVLFVFFGDDSETLEFANGIAGSSPLLWAHARIDRIVHARFGELRAIRSRRLYFDVYFPDGSVVQVDTEEQPGNTDGVGIVPQEQWETRVWLSHIRASDTDLLAASAYERRQQHLVQQRLLAELLGP